MACVVDHLRSGLSVRVLQDFTDARGIEVKAGERAVIDHLELDWSTFELAMVWVRSGRNEVLHFLHRATSGPRDGRMREFFEIETTKPPAPPSPRALARPPITSESPDSPPDGEDTLWSPAAGTPGSSAALPGDARETPLPPARTQEASEPLPPDQRRVACGCDPGLHRPVLDTVGEISVHACLGCGAVSATKCIGDDGRFTGNAWHAYVPVPVPNAVLAWLAQWPRVQSTLGPIRWPMAYELVRSETMYLPASTRAKTVEALARCETELARNQAGRNPGERLRDAGYPQERPPAGLPETLSAFSLVWQALQLRPGSELSELLHHARLRSPSSGVAVDLLMRRPDAVPVMLAALRSEEAGRRSAGIALARDLRPVSPELAPTVLEILEGLPLTPDTETPGRIAACARFEALLVLIAELRLGMPEVLTALGRLQHRLARHDATLVRCCQVVARELRGEPPPPPFGFLP